jgi:nucleoside-diphosphate-sugar epimerase
MYEAHFAAALVVPDSVRDPLGYYKNNTVNSRALIETAVKNGTRQFVFSSTCAIYGNPTRVPVTEQTPAAPISPYGWSKLMTEIMLRDASTAHDLRHDILRYFNVAGADPKCRGGQSTKNATQLIKVAVEAALGLRAKVDVYGVDYPTPDGTCIRDYIHVSDLVRAHSDALQYLRAGGASLTLMRLWPWFFGAGGNRNGQPRFWCRLQGRSRSAPAGGSSSDRRGFRSRPHEAWVEAAIRRPRRHRRSRSRLGAEIATRCAHGMTMMIRVHGPDD